MLTPLKDSEDTKTDEEVFKDFFTKYFPNVQITEPTKDTGSKALRFEYEGFFDPFRLTFCFDKSGKFLHPYSFATVLKKCDD